MPDKWKIRIRGSILLEALLAVIIFSISITVIIHSIASSSRAAVGAARYQEALYILENTLADIRISPHRQVPTTVKGYAGDYNIEMRLEPLLESEQEGINRISIKIAWDTAREAKQIVSQIYAF